jgi:putative redox protein
MPHARAVHVKGVSFLGIADSRHWVPLDGPAEFGGSDAGTRPKELLLLGLAGCTGSDVASMLDKMRVPYRKFEVDIHAEVASEHPKVYTKIEVVYKFWGEDLDPVKLERAIELSEKTYCSVSAMLRPSVALSSRYEINPEAAPF